jgi:hypothetical protein
LEIILSTDTDGFLSQECPSCNQQFKVVLGEGSEEPISFCPYCGHEGRDCWFTQEQIDHIQGVAVDIFFEPELKKMQGQLNNISCDLLKVDTNFTSPDIPVSPIEPDRAFDMFCFPCCKETIKAERHDKLFCIICGQEKDIKMSDAKKIFLSHKGVDKGTVKDFKNTLEALGYSPWIDEDAMPAGTTLERGILQGMQESCGVVFFITPSFKDEGYLETEVNYAISEKRKKGDKFSIISLQFVDQNGNKGKIPELLEHYVWKTPNSHLEALREIIRALPVIVNTVDWREGIDGVIVTPKIKSMTSELSEEAKVILKTAVSGDGSLMYLKNISCGPIIQAGGKDLIPNQDSRTIAHWVGGIEDLVRRRFIKDMGHKGESYEVTREGYQTADELGN